MASGTYNLEQFVFKAKLAEQAERYEEMKDFMKAVVQHEGLKNGLDQEQRNLLSVAYKNVVGARRASWRVLQQIMRKPQDDAALAKYTQEYQEMIEKELTDICTDVLTLLRDILLKNTKCGSEERVFYFKMKGDYHRYMAEYHKDPQLKDVIEAACSSYKEAYQAAMTLKATDPIRLGLALNFSVFYYEIQNDHKQACKLAKDAFDTAVTQLEALTEAQYKDATLIMQLLRDNLTLWQSEDNEDESTVEKDGTRVENI